MDTKRIIAELRAERERLDQAIAAIEGLNSAGRQRVGRPPRAAEKPRRRGRMSAAARRKLSRLLKQRWAQGKMKLVGPPHYISFTYGENLIPMPPRSSNWAEKLKGHLASA